jgi:type VI secretion system protein ImpA
MGGIVIRQQWLQPAASGPACGPDLEYDPDFLALQEAVRGRPEQQYGDTVIAAVEPDWNDVIARAAALLDRSRDIRIAHCLVRGLTRTAGIGGLRDGLVFIRELVDRFWDSVHPGLEFEGEPDPVLRLNALAALAENEGLVRDVRYAVFLRSPLGAIAVRDAEAILDRADTAVAQAISPEQLRMAIRDALAAEPASCAEIDEALAAVDGIGAVVGAHDASLEAPDLSTLRDTLRLVGGLVAGVRAELSGGAEPGAAATADAGAGAARPESAGVVAVGEIRSRDDAHRALERVCEFFARNEPTNPAPLLIRRAQRVMAMSFVDIIRDLAPDAVHQIENIAGTPPS